MQDLLEIQQLQREQICEFIKPLAESVIANNSEIADLENKVKKLKEQNANLVSMIRDRWLPTVSGSDNAALILGDIKIETKDILNVSVSEESADEHIEWLMSNGYKDVMKWQIHNATLKKIARELYEGDTKIPGLNYSEFKDIKIKRI